VTAGLDAWWQGVVLTDRQVQAVLLVGLVVLVGLFVREYRRLRRATPQAANSRQWQRLWRRFLRVSGLPERPHWTAGDYLMRLPAGWSPQRRAAAQRFLELYAAARFAPGARPTEAAAAVRQLRRRRLSG
jgi:predicted metal-dependent hydrolase